MRLLADMHIAPRTVRFLRSLGHDVVRVDERLLPTATDEAIVAAAVREERCIVTQDLDFSATVALSGRTAPSVISLRCRQGTGLFPAPAEMAYECTCPDGFGGGWLCKHVAATLYGIGVRLDEDPELLFRLRRVTHADLLARATAGLVAPAPPGRSARRTLAADRLSTVFGIDLEAGPAPRACRSARPPRSR